MIANTATPRTFERIVTTALSAVLLLIFVLLAFLAATPRAIYRGDRLARWLQMVDAPDPLMQRRAAVALGDALLLEPHWTHNAPRSAEALSTVLHASDADARSLAAASLARSGAAPPIATTVLATSLPRPTLSRLSEDTALELSRLIPSQASSLTPFTDAAARHFSLSTSTSELHWLAGAPPLAEYEARALRAAMDATSPDPAIRSQALNVLEAYGPFARDAGAIYRPGLSGSDDELRVASARGLGSLGPGSIDSVTLLSWWMRNAGPAGRTAMIEAVGRVAPNAPASIAAAKYPLLSLDPASQRFALDLQARKQTIRAIAPLLEQLKNPDATVRAAAAVALGRIGRRFNDVPQALRDLFRDSDPAVRGAAAWALGRQAALDPALVDFAHQPIRFMLKDADPVARAGAAIGLAEIAPWAGDSASHLLTLLDDSDLRVRAAAIRAVGEFWKSGQLTDDSTQRRIGTIVEFFFFGPTRADAGMDAVCIAATDALAQLPRATTVVFGSLPVYSAGFPVPAVRAGARALADATLAEDPHYKINNLRSAAFLSDFMLQLRAATSLLWLGYDGPETQVANLYAGGIPAAREPVALPAKPAFAWPDAARQSGLASIIENGGEHLRLTPEGEYILALAFSPHPPASAKRELAVLLDPRRSPLALRWLAASALENIAPEIAGSGPDLLRRRVEEIDSTRIAATQSLGFLGANAQLASAALEQIASDLRESPLLRHEAQASLNAIQRPTQQAGAPR